MTTIVIPSADRAKNVLTQVAGAILYVPQDQVEDYTRHNPQYTVVGHGPHRNLAEKRQEIYQRYKNVFMIDDDIYTIVRTHTDGNNRKDTLSPDDAAELIHATSKTAKTAGAYLYGFSSRPTPANYIPQIPIQLNTYINASAIGLNWSEKLYFTPKLTAAESYWINLLNAYFHRFSWCDTRFCFAQKQKSTFIAPGGQARNRTLASEKSDTLYLRRMFGQAVQKKPTTNQAKARHPYQRSLKLPF
jgi:hypothetical protein